jgi:hypothetical protein
MMVPLPETVLKIVFRNTGIPQQRHVALDIRNVSKSLPFRGYFNFGKSQKSQGVKSGE